MTPSTPYCTIPLTRGQVALVSPEDYEQLSAHKWCAAWNHHTKSYYAVRQIRDASGTARQYGLRMNREILGLARGDRRQGDHVNRNSLDNRRENLRIATPSQNSHNRKGQRGTAAGLKGVSKRADGKWAARIHVNGAAIFLGSFSYPELAYKKYCEAAQKLHGEFCNTGKEIKR